MKTIYTTQIQADKQTKGYL